MSSWVLAFVVFAVILGGSFGGMLLRLPVLAEDSKDLVRLGTGVIGTISALVLGLLIASAKTSYDTQRSQVRELTANIILLDRVLAEYGPEANAARDALRRSITPLVDQIWRGSSGVTATTPFEPTATIEEALHKVQELSPRDDNQRALQARAIQVFADSLVCYSLRRRTIRSPSPSWWYWCFGSPSFSPVSVSSLVQTQQS